jgi:ergothioneine biosynthesis protein EgtB
MSAKIEVDARKPSFETLRNAVDAVRRRTLALSAPLEIEDYGVQSMPDASPAKWHLAHTTWFFERFVLSEALPRFRVYDERYEYLFNSYYDAVGPRHARAERGLLTRPTVDEVIAYRGYVDARLGELFSLDGAAAGCSSRIELGLHHEQQHQELLLTDIKHAFSRNPLEPAYGVATPRAVAQATPLHWHAFRGGLHEIGAEGDGFCFDNELPRHQQYVPSFEIAHRLVTNGEYLEFIRDGGYARPELWLSDGWQHRSQHNWQHPLYWSDDLESQFTLAGRRTLDPAEPVCHVSYYEADAYARWAKARLPTEAEWEIAARSVETTGNFVESGRLQPNAATRSPRLQQMFGDVWEWTASPYMPYPGFRAGEGALGEYNGKFMANQFVLRGGSCVTPADHIRRSYRNFFYPHQRWQFTGIRLARETLDP